MTDYIPDYVPKTQEIRRSASWNQLTNSYGIKKGKEFDRWLNEVKAEAWEEGLYAGAADSYFGYPDNPYRQVGDV